MASQDAFFRDNRKLEVYFSSKGYIHRDLAARNVLITSDKVAKIADFGLCRRTHEEIYTMQRETKLPVKWTAPEAMTRAHFSEKSDVYVSRFLD